MLVLGGRGKVLAVRLSAELARNSPHPVQLRALAVAARRSALSPSVVLLCGGDRTAPPAPSVLELARLGHHDKVVAALSKQQRLSIQQVNSSLRFTSLHLATLSELEDVLRALLSSEGCPPIDSPDANGVTALHLACGMGAAGLARALVEAGAKLEVPVEGAGVVSAWRGWRPLHLAANTGCVETVRVLLGAGAAVDSKGPDNDTPLILACRNNHTQVVRALLEAGANPSHETNPIGKGGWDLRSVWTPLTVAAKHGASGEVCELLLARGADVNHAKRDPTGHTALHEACLARNADVIQALVASPGVDVNVKDASGETPIEALRRRGVQSGPLVDLLRSKGAHQ